jgi:hypothetical protein
MKIIVKPLKNKCKLSNAETGRKKKILIDNNRVFRVIIFVAVFKNLFSYSPDQMPDLHNKLNMFRHRASQIDGHKMSRNEVIEKATQHFLAKLVRKQKSDCFVSDLNDGYNTERNK